MTVVNVTAALTALGGSVPVASGRITVEYLRGKDGEPAARAVGAAVTLPAPIVIAIVDGSPVEPVDVPPTDGTCYARIWVECRAPRDAGFLELPAVAIPATGPVDLTALQAVDPASFEPVTTVVTAWQLAVDQVSAMQADVTVKSAQAVQAAADAGTFAGAADFDADRAGLSAFAAGQSAASALGHKNAASGSADAAAGSATSAAASVVAASTERQGAADERLGARQERQDAQTARTGAETAQTGAQTARTGAETARTGAESAKTGAEAARDVALAGQFAGASLGTADLDTVTTPGVYRQNNQGNSTLARNYPAAGTLGALTVIQASTDSWMQQEYDPSGYAGQGRVVYRRVRTGGTWQPWRAFAAQRATKTAGQPGTELALWSEADAAEVQLHTVRIALSAADLNTVQVPGSYAVLSADATLARNCPREGLGGVLEVLQESGVMTLTQRFTPRSTPEYARVFYERQYVGGAWRPWYAFGAQRVDKTAGIAIYTWDDVSGRDHLIFGDTGMRDLTSLLGPLWDTSSTLLVRRRLNVITWYFNIRPKAALAGTTQHAVLASGTVLPSGLENVSGVPAFDTFLSAVGVPGVQPWLFNRTSSASQGADLKIYAEAGQIPALTWLRGVVQHDTASAWPTTLPGFASGTIPNA